MAETRSFLCPACGQDLQIDPRIVQGVIACPTCGRHVEIPRRTGVEVSQAPAEAIEARPAVKAMSPPANLAVDPDDELLLPDIQLKSGPPVDAMALMALLLPLVVQCVLFLGNFESAAVNQGLSWGTILFTAVLLSWDAYYLGTIDVQGQQRGGPVPLFFGLLIFWLIFYPLVYFRRRHFGRPNLGPIALVVAVIFVAAPFVRPYLDSTPPWEDGPPSCTSREVKSLVDDLIRKSQLGADVRTIGHYREVKHDPVAKTRRGRCLVQTDMHRITVAFEVSWVDQNRRTYQVRLLDAQDDPRGYLGIIMERAAQQQNDGDGVFVRDVLPGEAADRAGIQPGDMLVRVNQQAFGRNEAIQKCQQLVMDTDPGGEITVDLLRDGQRRQVRVVVGARPLHLP